MARGLDDSQVVASTVPAPHDCLMHGGSFNIIPSTRASSALVGYMGIVCGPGAFTRQGRMFQVAVNLWEETGTHWAWVSVTFRVTGINITIPAGVITGSCRHGAPVKAVINYWVGGTETTFQTNLSHCS